MRTSEERTGFYRERIAECERLAASATTPESRDTLVHIGLRWQALADVERCRSRPDDPGAATIFPAD